MFKSFEELVRFRRTRLQIGWERFLSALSGIALSAVGFQAVYSLLFAIE